MALNLEETGAAWLSEIEGAPDLLGLHAVLDRVFGLFGIQVYRYHVIAEGLRNLRFLDSMKLSTVPAEWVQRYALSDFFLVDPVIEHAQNSTRPVRWSEIESQDSLSEKQRQYFREVRQFGFSDGWGVPVFGPAQIVGYFGVGRMSGPLDLSETELLALQALCERAHLRMFDLNLGERTRSTLSKREIEILEWVSVSKSNDVIATILGISRHTVDTHVRRIFSKLEATNRTEAVLAGFQSGALTLARYRTMRGLSRRDVA
ncbi:MAG: LuxR family transcriptional regulator [Rhizobiaceae bacterium]|nr:LuxR family transcriptional regulator [Rhizobiaceae bacterium]